jgi:hypothetical protein
LLLAWLVIGKAMEERNRSAENSQYFLRFLCLSWDSSVGTATRYELDGPGIESLWEAKLSAPVQTSPGAQPTPVPFLGVKWAGRGFDYSPSSMAEVKERVQLYIYSTSVPSWHVIGWYLPYLYPYLYIFDLFNRDLLNHFESVCNLYNRLLIFLNVGMWNVELSLSHILIQLFRPFVTGSDESGWDHMAADLASPDTSQIAASPFLFCLSLNYVYCYVLYGVRPSLNHWIYSRFARRVCVSFKNPSFSLCFVRLLYNFIPDIS